MHHLQKQVNKLWLLQEHMMHKDYLVKDKVVLMQNLFKRKQEINYF